MYHERGLRTNRVADYTLVATQSMKLDSFNTKLVLKTWKILGEWLV